MSKNFPPTPTYSNAHAKVKKFIFNVQFPGDRFGMGIIFKDFLKLFNLSYLDKSFIHWVKKFQNPGIQPSYAL